MWLAGKNFVAGMTGRSHSAAPAIDQPVEMPVSLLPPTSLDPASRGMCQHSFAPIYGDR